MKCLFIIFYSIKIKSKYIRIYIISFHSYHTKFIIGKNDYKDF